jgi:hypothetical protein
MARLKHSMAALCVASNCAANMPSTSSRGCMPIMPEMAALNSSSRPYLIRVRRPQAVNGLTCDYGVECVALRTTDPL